MNSPEFEALLDLSARICADPSLVQGAGGNTSIKEAGTLWIKASGLWLMQARERDVMVPVALDPLLEALERDDPACEKAEGFVLADRNPSGLRPSIETTVHALMPQKIVVHVHCVETIATAVQVDAEAIAAGKLADLPYAFIPYARPGLPLAKAIAARLRDGISVLILGNHGLVVAAETVAEAEALLHEIGDRLRVEPRGAPMPDKAALVRLALGSDYTLPDDEAVHAAATDLESVKIGAAGNLYPDHVIFLGEALAIAGPDETAAEVASKHADAPPVILFPGKGVLARRDITAGASAMARCFADVAARIPQGARLRYLTSGENAELLGWDAEKYRQALNARAGGVLQ
jgi:rhamnose utilization protein RhaD (predicted bifunctional aldolase and dehydrogenase)